MRGILSEIYLVSCLGSPIELPKVLNIGSGNGLVPDGTKPLPKPMLAYQSLKHI